MSQDPEADGYEHLGFLLLLGLLTIGVVFVVWPFATPLLWAALAAIMKPTNVAPAPNNAA